MDSHVRWKMGLQSDVLPVEAESGESIYRVTYFQLTSSVQVLVLVLNSALSQVLGMPEP